MAIFTPEFPTWQDAFLNALGKLGGTTPKDIKADGKIHRFSFNGKKTNQSGWYVVYQDEVIGGCIGNWGSGEKINWYWSSRLIGEFEKTALHEKWAEAKKRADEEHAKEQAAVALKAQAKWADMVEAEDSHPYLIKKGVKAHDIKMGKERLYISLTDENGTITSLQSIDEKGQKLFMPGGRVKGCYFLIGSPKDELLVAEGYATGASLFEATGKPVMVTFNAGNIGPAIDSIKQRFPSIKLTICADNDESGLKHAHEAAKKFACDVKIPTFSASELEAEHKPTDFNDYVRLRGTEALKKLFAAPEKLKFNFITIEDLEAMPPVGWVIDKVFPEQSFGIIYGAPKKGKTFVALDFALSVASGNDWHGKPVKQGSVLYIAGEGVGGLRKRVKAWRHKYQADANMPFYVLPTAVNMALEIDVNELLRSIDAFGHKFSLIFIDTVARALAGADENSSTDVGLFIGNCDLVKSHTKSAVIGVHHSGKDEAKGMRGSSALLGGVDTVLKVSKEENLVTIICEEQKDDEPFDDVTLKAELVNFGITASSLVLVDTQEQTQKSVKLSPTERRAYQYLLDCVGGKKIRGCPTAQESVWRSECYRRTLTVGDEKAKRNGFNTVLRKLIEKGKIVVENGTVLIMESASESSSIYEQNGEEF